MVRAKKHETKFWWTEAVKIAGERYNYKWVEGPLGRIWLSSIYHDRELQCLYFEGVDYWGFGKIITVNELDTNYTIVSDRTKANYK